MWKKIALGCALVVALVVVLAAAAGFWIWNRHGDDLREGFENAGELMEAGKTYQESFSKLGEIAELDRDIEADPDYQPPADGELTAEQVDRLLAVQRRVRADMGGRLESFRARYEDRDDVSVSEALEGLNELGDLAIEAKRHQVEAVNESGFSREEYAWVKRQAYVAVGFSDVAVDLNAIGDAVRRGDYQEVVDEMNERKVERETAVPPQNAALVEPHRDELEEWFPLALLGL
ncbi:MAG TPA: hypothetical protein VKU40_17670 [Thermoanaerobaculia bacterium]|nr:hypothetical protein [Thermoanaerobaculia bacterium]